MAEPKANTVALGLKADIPVKPGSHIFSSYMKILKCTYKNSN